MKNRSLNLLIGSVLTLAFSCQPKDEKLQRPGSNGGNNANQSSAGSNMNAQENNQLIALSIDRMVEAVHLLKAALNPDYAIQYNISVTDQKNQASVVTKSLSNRVDLSDLKIVSSKNETNTKDKQPTTKNANMNLNIRRLLTDEEGTVLQFVAVKEVPDEIRNAGYIYDAKKNPVDFLSVTQTQSLSIQQLEVGRYSVAISRGDFVSSKKDSSSLMVSRIAFEFHWSGKILDLDEVIKMKFTSVDVSRMGNKSGLLNVKGDEIKNEMLLKLAECASVVGAVQISIKQPRQNGKDVPNLIRTLVIQDSSVKMADENSFHSPAVDCKVRPVVDLTRML